MQGQAWYFGPTLVQLLESRLRAMSFRPIASLPAAKQTGEGGGEARLVDIADLDHYMV
jgi:hypothetical protein